MLVRRRMRVNLDNRVTIALERGTVDVLVATLSRSRDGFSDAVWWPVRGGVDHPVNDRVGGIKGAVCRQLQAATIPLPRRTRAEFTRGLQMGQVEQQMFDTERVIMSRIEWVLRWRVAESAVRHVVHVRLQRLHHRVKGAMAYGR